MNSELVTLYWDVGTVILAEQTRHDWGDDVIGLLAADLRANEVLARGFSRRNLMYMRQFAALWPPKEFAHSVNAQIGWTHHMRLLDAFGSDRELYAWYATRAIEEGWSARELKGQIDLKVHARLGAAVTNVPGVIDEPAASQVVAALKNPYVLDFIELGRAYKERDLEQALIDDIQRFLRELGVGFAFYGRQQSLEIGGQEFFLDLIFYHHRLRRFVVIDLKIGEFEAEFAGKMGLYLNAVDEQLRHPDDAESIGLILCTSHNATVAKFALHRHGAPIAIADWQTALEVDITDEIPEALQHELTGMPQVRDQLTSRVARATQDAHARLAPEIVDGDVPSP